MNWQNIIEFVIGLGAFVAAIATIDKFSRRLNISKGLRHWLIGDLAGKVDRTHDRVEALEVWQLKQIICNSDVPDSERLIAGDRYLELGGNGDVKTVLEVIKAQYKKEIEKKEEER